MSVSRDFYVVYGKKIEWNEAISDAIYEGEHEEELADIIVDDGMSGEYMVIGKVIACFGGYAHDGDSMKITSILPQELLKMETEIRNKFTELLPEFSHFVEGQFDLISFEHYS